MSLRWGQIKLFTLTDRPRQMSSRVMCVQICIHAEIDDVTWRLRYQNWLLCRFFQVKSLFCVCLHCRQNLCSVGGMWVFQNRSLEEKVWTPAGIDELFIFKHFWKFRLVGQMSDVGKPNVYHVQHIKTWIEYSILYTVPLTSTFLCTFPHSTRWRYRYQPCSDKEPHFRGA